MSKRSRSVGVYSPRQQFLHHTVDEFTTSTSVEPGVHTVRCGDMLADILYDERPDSDTLLVFFSAAANHHHTWPLFSGASIAASINASLLSFSDPSIALGLTVSTGWTLGDYRYPYHRDVPDIVRKVADGRSIIMVGASAGGYAALHYGAKIPESFSVVMNPRTHLLLPPTGVQLHSTTLYQSQSPEHISTLVPVEPDLPENKVLYLQNYADHAYFSSHMIPYLHRLSPEMRVWTHLDYWGEGHVPMPKSELVAFLSALISDPGELLDSLRRFESVNRILDHHAGLNILHFAKQ